MMNICRLCLGNVYVNNPLFGSSNDILRKILTLFPLEISEFDCLPKMVCHNCSCKINDMAKFRKIVTEADRQLRELTNGNGKLEELYNEIINRNVTIKVEDEFEQAKPYVAESRASEMVERGTQTELSRVLEEAPMNYVDVSIKKEEVEDFDDERKYNDANLDDYLSSDDNISLVHLTTTKHFVKLESASPTLEGGMAETRPRKARVKKFKLASDWPRDASHEMKRKKKHTFKKEQAKSTKQTLREAAQKGLEDGKSRKDSPETEKTWKCLTCFVCVDSRLDLLAHYKQHITGIRNDISPQEGVEERPVWKSETPEYIIVKRESGEGFLCTKCNKVFNAKKYIRKHVMSHIQDRPYVCNVCGRTYNMAYEIVLHGRAHSGSKTLFCNYEDCSYSTVYKGALISHQRKHDDNFKYKCKICQKGFDVLTWFNEHHNVHTGAKPFKCDFCDKCFVYSRYLTSHRKSVHPECCPPTAKRLPHKCSDCGEETASRRALRRHMRRHAAAELVLCDICGKGLSSREHLKFHRRMHLGVKPHACRTCGKAFVKKCNLKLHERVHSGERPHVCSHCGKAFSQRSTLVIHERYHSGARPYKCEVCEKAFVARGLLSVHQKTCC